MKTCLPPAGSLEIPVPETGVGTLGIFEDFENDPSTGKWSVWAAPVGVPGLIPGTWVQHSEMVFPCLAASTGFNKTRPSSPSNPKGSRLVFDAVEGA
ncbi:MAG: hypothetical protein APR55_04210 [Methanolinea sp. SDB]|nr:MAG: hypothetical protein APR55_04210 [Methanolinea sp. SDB]